MLIYTKNVFINNLHILCTFVTPFLCKNTCAPLVFYEPFLDIHIKCITSHKGFMNILHPFCWCFLNISGTVLV